MSAWKQKFDVRCRRLLGVTDDTQSVHVYTSTGDMGGCDTCGYGGSDPIEITCAGKSKTYSDMGDLIRDLDEVVM